MEKFDIKHEDFATVARMTSEEVLATYQSSRIVVLVLQLPGAPFTTLFTMPPKGQSFAQDWWLGQAYCNWKATVGLDDALGEMMMRGLKKAGVEFKRLPLNLLPIRGEFDKRKTVDEWDPCVFISALVPSEAVECTLSAFDASHELVSDYLFVPKGNDYASTRENRYGEPQIERALGMGFPKPFYHGIGYRNALQQLIVGYSFQGQSLIPVPSAAEQKTCLQQMINDLEDLAAKVRINRGDVLWGAHGEQFFYLLDAKECEPELLPLVVTVNTYRARVLKALNSMHFFWPVAMRRLHIPMQTLKNTYRYEPNDRDWLLHLKKVSPESLSPDFEELKNIDDYIAAMKQEYPCLEDDPLKKVLPTCSTRAFKI